MKRLFWLLLFVLMLSACSENKTLKSEIVQLKNQVKQLQEELEKYKYDPVKLLAEAKTNFENRNFEGVDVIKEQIIKYHPQSEEKKEIEALCLQIEKIKKDDAEKAEKERIRKEEERLASVKKLKKDYDDVSGITWYKQPYFVHYNNTNLISLYIGQKDKDVWLRLKMSYYGDDWIFFENAYLSYDGNTKEIMFDKYEEKETDHDSKVWEWIDVPVNQELYAYLNNFINGNNLKMRFSGKYTKTKDLNVKEKKGLKDVLTAYQILKKNIR